MLADLQSENARLIALLESRGIEWRAPSVVAAAVSEPSKLSTAEKLSLCADSFEDASMSIRCARTCDGNCT